VVKGLAAEKKTVPDLVTHPLRDVGVSAPPWRYMERGGRMVISGTIAEIQERIMGGAVLVVEVLGDSGSLVAIVEADPLAESVEQADGTFSIRYRGDAEQASELLAAMIRGGVRVASFARRREGLEELFLKVVPRIFPEREPGQSGERAPYFLFLGTRSRWGRT